MAADKATMMGHIKRSALQNVDKLTVLARKSVNQTCIDEQCLYMVQY